MVSLEDELILDEFLKLYFNCDLEDPKFPELKQNQTKKLLKTSVV